jgi:hypothetical protein
MASRGKESALVVGLIVALTTGACRNDDEAERSAPATQIRNRVPALGRQATRATRRRTGIAGSRLIDPQRAAVTTAPKAPQATPDPPAEAPRASVDQSTPGAMAKRVELEAAQKRVTARRELGSRATPPRCPEPLETTMGTVVPT